MSPSPLQTHPNTSRVVGGGTSAALVVWVAGRFGLPLSAEEGATAATLVGGVWVFIGRDGIRGALRRLWRGQPQ